MASKIHKSIWSGNVICLVGTMNRSEANSACALFRQAGEEPGGGWKPQKQGRLSRSKRPGKIHPEMFRKKFFFQLLFWFCFSFKGAGQKQIGQVRENFPFDLWVLRKKQQILPELFVLYKDEHPHWWVHWTKCFVWSNNAKTRSSAVRWASQETTSHYFFVLQHFLSKFSIIIALLPEHIYHPPKKK